MNSILVFGLVFLSASDTSAKETKNDVPLGLTKQKQCQNSDQVFLKIKCTETMKLLTFTSSINSYLIMLLNIHI